MAAPPAGRRRLLKLLSALLAVLAVCAALWPFAIQWASGARLSREAAAATAAHVPATAVDRRDLKAARAYNARLARSGQPRLGASMFRAGGSPDFSGSSDRPYMSVLPDSLLFTRLDEARRGDVFYILVRGATLAYRVDRISVVDPSDTSLLRVRAGEDRATLVTCTPYGVNSHRLLVSGPRARMPEQAPYPKDAKGDAKGRAMGVAAAVGACGLPVAARLSRRPLPCRHRIRRRPRHSA